MPKDPFKRSKPHFNLGIISHENDAKSLLTASLSIIFGTSSSNNTIEFETANRHYSIIPQCLCEKYDHWRSTSGWRNPSRFCNQQSCTTNSRITPSRTSNRSNKNCRIFRQVRYSK